MGLRGIKWAMAVATLGATVTVSSAQGADGISTQIDGARAAYQKSDLARTAQALEAALTEVQDRLGRALFETLPPPPSGWEADPPELQGLGQVGGGLSVTRAYSKGEASLNASLFLDSPAVEAASVLVSNPAAVAAQPNTRHVKVGGDDALLRFDPSTKSGEITVVLNNRVLLEIEGDNVAGSDVLIEAAKGWNVPRIRAIAGLSLTQ